MFVFSHFMRTLRTLNSISSIYTLAWSFRIFYPYRCLYICYSYPNYATQVIWFSPFVPTTRWPSQFSAWVIVSTKKVTTSWAVRYSRVILCSLNSKQIKKLEYLQHIMWPSSHLQLRHWAQRLNGVQFCACGESDDSGICSVWRLTLSQNKSTFSCHTYLTTARLVFLLYTSHFSRFSCWVSRERAGTADTDFAKWLNSVFLPGTLSGFVFWGRCILFRQ